jgi:ribA/ribD-fused uncharacterized protein
MNEFSGKFRFLSNFYPCIVMLDGVAYASVEHAYQAAKTFDLRERWEIRQMPTAGKAKRRGSKVTLRPDWDEVKVSIMRDLVRQKFSRPELRDQLRAVKGPIVEGNNWGDTFWGVCNGVGTNWLGRILEEVRDEVS